MDLKTALEQYGVRTYEIEVPIRGPTMGLLWELSGRLEREMENSAGCDRVQFDDSADDGEPKSDCNCDFCRAQALMDEIRTLTDPDHRSLNPERATGAEAIYLKRWQSEQIRHPAINGGGGLLEILLSPTRIGHDKPRSLGGLVCRRTLFPVSQRDAEVAATVIQWLGTNCGQGFMIGAEAEIAKERAIRNDFEDFRVNDLNRTRSVMTAAEKLARHAISQTVPADRIAFEPLVKNVTAAIEAVQGKRMRPAWDPQCPDMCGLYWWRPGEGKRAEIVEIYQVTGGTPRNPTWENWARGLGKPGVLLAGSEYLSGQWGDRIRTPSILPGVDWD